MRLWRICRKTFAKAALTGEGGLHASGRWHHRGIRVVYCAEHSSLAALEALVHFDPSNAPGDLVLVEIDAPDVLSIEKVDRTLLPAGWRTTPAPQALQDLGTSWLEARTSALLRVPSAVIQSESNLLLNPEHPDAAKVRVVATVPFTFDPRLVADR